MHPFSRRHFLVRAAGGTLAGLLVSPPTWMGAAPSRRPGQPRFRLGLAAYSLRDYMRFSDHPRDRQVPPERQIDPGDFLDYCADQGCDGAELTGYYFPPEANREYFLGLRRQAHLRGIAISGSAVGNRFTLPPGPAWEAEIRRVERGIEQTAWLGASHLRVFAGTPPDGLSAEQAKAQCVSALQRCADYAASHGVFLGLENHGGIVAQAADLIEIVEQLNHPWVRVNLDTGNFYSPDPYADLARLAPYAVNVQYKVEINRTPGGKEPADLRRIMEILRSANYQGYVVLEYEASEDPWTAIPRHLGDLRRALVDAGSVH